MSKRSYEYFLIDALVALHKIERYHEQHDNAEDFYHDEKSFDATMRELQIIGEATKHLLNANLLDDTYRIVVDFRNLIVHEYFGIDADEIWDILHNELPPFKRTLLDLLAESDCSMLISVIDGSLMTYMGETAQYLKQLKKHILQS